MKIHGTAKGGAIGKKDFGVAFSGGNGGEVCEWTFDNDDKKACDNFSSDEFTHVSTSGSNPDTWGIDTDSGVWTAVFGRGEGVKGMYRALPETIDADFCMRVGWKATSALRCTGGCASSYCGYHFLGLSSSNSCNSATAQDFCGLSIIPYTGADSTAVVLSDNGAYTSATSWNITGDFISDFENQFYLEIVRDSDDVTVTFYDDEDFSSAYGAGTRSVATTATNDLDYVVASNVNVGTAPYGTAYTEITNLNIWKDVTSPP